MTRRDDDARDAAFEAEVYYAMDEFGIDYSRARHAVAEKAVVTAIVDFGAWCRTVEP